MTDDQQRARELQIATLAESSRCLGVAQAKNDIDASEYWFAKEREAIAALRAAPEGFVMVPVEPTDELTLRIAKALQASEQSGWTWEDCSPIEVEGWMELATAAIAAFAARPQGVK
jgi:hypothetical protein